MSPRKRLRCLRNAAWLQTKLRTKSRLYCRNAQIAQFLGSTDSRVCLQRRTRRGQRKVRLSVERLAHRCPCERVHACSSDLLYKRAKSSIRLKTISFFQEEKRLRTWQKEEKKKGFEHGSSESNNCRGFSCGSCEGTSAKFYLLENSRLQKVSRSRG